jgi:HlyD family secretion protein
MGSARPWRRWGLRALAGAAALAVGAGGWLVLRPVSVQVADVVVRDLTPAVQGVGTVEAKVVVQISPKIAGRLVTVLVDQGHAVETGQIVARLDEAQLSAEVRRSEAAVQAAEAQLRDLLAGTRREEILEAEATALRAQAQLDDLLAGSRQQEIEELRQRVESARATRVLAERDRQRVQQLYLKELIAAQEVDRARQASEVATAQERAAAETLQMAIEGARPRQIEAGRAQLTAAQARLALLRAGPRPDQVIAARAQLGEAQAARALARERLADTVLRSPLDGIVVSRDLEPGATVNPGTPVLKVVDPRTAWVTVYVDERETQGLAVRDAVDIALRSLPGRTLPGRVARIQRESDRVTEQLPVDVAFEERPPRLTLGEQAEATIRGAGRRGVPSLPLAAVVRGSAGLGAWTVADGRLRFRPIRVGVTDVAGWAEVLEGLRPGERVVVAPGRLADPASEGRRVRVTPMAAPAGDAGR